ncbi:MAG TPA: hypothetical protein DEO84_03175 [candidate division Zixibacteria bacterium]|nr:hypothetical protein [candidate division Zixibacteria bacterium]HBZ00303.1 hypothetical protein [candidate division Zixibacteria bacterium]
MNNTKKKSSMIDRYGSLSIILIALLSLLIVSLTYLPAMAQNGQPAGPGMGVGGFVDEDGDGFNDLLPDSDGDGVPDAIDPDSRNKNADSLFMHQHMQGRGDSTGMGYRMMGDSLHMGGMRDPYEPHDGDGHGLFPYIPGSYPGMPGPMPGEPGQYGPGDSTGHGGMHDGHWGDGDHHGDWPPPPPLPPDSNGMGGGKIGHGNGTGSIDHSYPGADPDPLKVPREGSTSADPGKTISSQSK